MDPESLRYGVSYNDEMADVPVGGRRADRVAVLAGAEGETQQEFVRSTCRLEGSVTVSATDAMRLEEEGAIERKEPEGLGQRVYFDLTGSGDTRPAAFADVISLLREVGFREAADFIQLDQIPC